MARNFTQEYRNSTSLVNPDDACLQQQAYLEQNKSQATAIAILNIPFFITALVGNSAILIAIWKTPSLHSPANILLANLAVSDFGVGLIVQPAGIFFLLTGIHGFSLANRVLCTVGFHEVAYVFVGVSSFTITAIGLERLSALQLHLRYNSVITKFRVILAVIGIWLCVALLSLSWLWKSKTFIVIPILTGIIIAANFAIYLKIHFIVRRHQAQIRNQQPQVHNGNNFSLILRLKSSVVNTFLVFILMVCCYTPHMVGLVKGKPSHTVYFITATIVYLNSSFNPVLYCWRVRELRSAVKGLFRFWEFSKHEDTLCKR